MKAEALDYCVFNEIKVSTDNDNTKMWHKKIIFSLPPYHPSFHLSHLHSTTLSLSSHHYSFFTLPVSLSLSPPQCTCPPSYLLLFIFFVTLTHHPLPPPFLPLWLALTDPMCALCSRSRGLKRSTSAHVGTGIKAPSAARRRKSLVKDSKDEWIHTSTYSFLFICTKKGNCITRILNPSQVPYILTAVFQNCVRD